MKAQTHVNPWWAALTVWSVMNAVSLFLDLAQLGIQTEGVALHFRRNANVGRSREGGRDFSLLVSVHLVKSFQ
jgi:hypothetical protein